MKKSVKNPRWLSVVLAAYVIIFLSGCTIGKKAHSDNKLIAEGVRISGIEVGSVTKEKAMEAINKKVSSMGIPIFEFRYLDKKFSVSAEEIELTAEVEKTIEKAYALGRGKNEKDNKNAVAKAKKEGLEIPLGYSFSKDKFLVIANDYLADKIKDPSPMEVEIGTDCLMITNALPGKAVNTDGLKEAIEKELTDFVSDNPIELTLKEIENQNLSFDEFKAQYLRNAKDAKYSKKDGIPCIEPEVVGIDFDEKEARMIFEKNQNSKTVYRIPAVITIPKVTAKSLENKYMNVTLASYSTSFAGSSSGRIENIRLAVSKINGYVLNPGEKFSYNQVVGPRTEAAGFKLAQVYVGNQVVDGIGGGICQVSSALYNAVVLADLETVTRTNHSIPVNYVPKGRDATVAYGTIDYAFSNNKPFPVGIRASVSGTTLTISVVGASKMDYVVEFVAKQTDIVPFSTIRENSSDLPYGVEKTVTDGTNGAVYESYRVYKRNGVEYDRKHESKSRYVPVSKKVLVGTKKASDPQKPHQGSDNEEPEKEISVSASASDTPGNSHKILVESDKDLFGSNDASDAGDFSLNSSSQSVLNQ